MINRGSLTFWIAKEAIQLWHPTKQGNHGRPCLFSDCVITMTYIVKCAF
ncbi:Mobile element protein [Candidatus Enterovibrio altilux]|uniref:Mobile element protein n=1 Tax=Candidatus Enterovibrio altilux TaxID=1927128 RepID=A0A291B766_9GAMM|nr:Mobile element protein [Candidatus Enterovibrio luxaltus]